MNNKSKKIDNKEYHKNYYQKHKQQLDYYYKNKEKILKKKKLQRDNSSIDVKLLNKLYQREYYKLQKDIKVFCNKCNILVVKRSWYLHTKTLKHTLTKEELIEHKKNIKKKNKQRKKLTKEEKEYYKWRYSKYRERQLANKKKRAKEKKAIKQKEIMKIRLTKPFDEKIIIY